MLPNQELATTASAASNATRALPKEKRMVVELLWKCREVVWMNEEEKVCERK